MMRIWTTAALLLLVSVAPVLAQAQKIAYVDSDYILGKLPEYGGLEQRLRALATEWQQEMQAQQRVIDELKADYQAREILFTEEVREQKRVEIATKERALVQYEQSKFGPEGEYFRQQATLLEPIQRRVMAAIEAVATRDGYDFVFDRSGDFLFLYTRAQWNLSDEVLIELGIAVGE